MGGRDGERVAPKQVIVGCQPERILQDAQLAQYGVIAAMDEIVSGAVQQGSKQIFQGSWARGCREAVGAVTDLAAGATELDCASLPALLEDAMTGLTRAATHLDQRRALDAGENLDHGLDELDAQLVGAVSKVARIDQPALGLIAGCECDQGVGVEGARRSQTDRRA